MPNLSLRLDKNQKICYTVYIKGEANSASPFYFANISLTISPIHSMMRRSACQDPQNKKKRPLIILISQNLLPFDF